MVLQLELGSVLNTEAVGSAKTFGHSGEVVSAPALSISSNPSLYGFAGGTHSQESSTITFGVRDYDANTGRWNSQDPIGLSSGDLNNYRYVGNNPMGFVDAFGLYEIEVSEKDKRDGKTYGAVVRLKTKYGQVITVSGSSYPNPLNKSPGIASGTFPSKFSNVGHRGKQPGIRVNNGNKIPTTGPNPNQDNNWFATGINIHCGYSQNIRGSEGCITINPSQCSEFFNGIEENETGPVKVER